MSPTFGPVAVPDDETRILTQMDRVREYMLATYPTWRTLGEISAALARRYGKPFPEASVSAQLRHLRKERFGSYMLERQSRSGGLHEYRLLFPEPKKGQGKLF